MAEGAGVEPASSESESEVRAVIPTLKNVSERTGPHTKRRHAESPSAMLGSNGTSAARSQSSLKARNRRTPQTDFLFC